MLLLSLPTKIYPCDSSIALACLCYLINSLAPDLASLLVLWRKMLVLLKHCQNPRLQFHTIPSSTLVVMSTLVVVSP